MSGKLIAIALLICAAVAGGALYYLQVYGYYRTVEPTGADVVIGGAAIDQSGFRAIDADSSPIRYRACFDTTARPDDLAARHDVVADAVPRNAPGWFGCFDAAAIAAELDAGTATAFMGTKNIAYGVDRIVAITRDGRGFVWHELNACGEKAYDGTVVGEACPPRPATP